MISSRTRGLAKICVVCQAILVTLAFWLWLPLSQRHWEIWNLNLPRYAFYNAVLLVGLAFGYATSTDKTWFAQLAFFNCQRHAFRQTAFSAGLLLLSVTGERNPAISRLFLFTFLPILYGMLVSKQ